MYCPAPSGESGGRTRRLLLFFAAIGGLLPAAAAAAGLDAELGRAIFERPWVTAPSSTRAADGLGPHYNERSCVTCHPGNGGGRAPAGDGSGDMGKGFALRLDSDPVYGRQLQTHAIIGLPAEGRIDLRWAEETVAYPDGATARLRRPVVSVADPAYGAVTAATSPRVAPPVRGLGLLERVPEADILANADPADRDGDGVAGRAARVDGAVGRFGWKAAHATLTGQHAEAFSLDIGMSTPNYPDPWGDCTAAQDACRASPTGASPEFEGLEIPSAVLRLVDAYVRALPAPGATPPIPLFAETGCAACHRPRFEVGGKPVFAYTDLLLHDVGPALADGVPGPDAGGAEWRTPPLWGLNRLAGEDGALSLLHDGRARSIEEAILWHGGEAAAAKHRYMALPPAERERLLRFLRTL